MNTLSAGADFTTIALSNDEPISKAIEIAFSGPNHSLYLPPNQYKILNGRISKFANGHTIGSLRAFSNQEWDLFMQHFDFPLICKRNLKRLIIESQDLTKKQILECDFNSGLHFEWSSVQQQIIALVSSGFTLNNAREAIMVIEHQPDNEPQSFDFLQSQTNYLVMDDISKKIMYNRAKKDRNQSVTYNNHYSVVGAVEQQNNWEKLSSNELSLTIQKLKHDLNKLKIKRINLERERDKMNKKNKLTLYSEYIRGIIGDQVVISDFPSLVSGHIRKQQATISQIVPYDVNGIILLYCSKPYVIPVNATKTFAMGVYQDQRKITHQNHIDIISALGYDQKMFRKFQNYLCTIDINIPSECTVCYQQSANHMILPCYHVCLGSECAEEYFAAPHDGQKCPLCDIQVKDVKQIFYL